MSLKALAHELNALEPSELRAPKLPMAVVLQEAAELARLCAEPDVSAALLGVGQPRTFLAELATRLEAAREAEAQWALERKGPGRSRYQQILTEARQAKASR